MRVALFHFRELSSLLMCLDTMNPLKIDVWSDVVCPFCYLGKRKLEHALEKLGLTDQVVVEWHSFQLDTTFPKGTSVLATEHLAQRKGIPMASLETAQQRLTDQGKLYGIDFRFDRAMNFNTLDVHRLLLWSKSFQKADALKTALFKAHFTNGLDLSKSEILKQIAVSIGLDGEAALHVLNSQHYSAEVQQDIANAQQIGIRGVPFFVFNKKTALSGAQPDSVFEEVIQQAITAIP
jgi:predicted DsbA family dithiol-disulfide isomerase